MPDVSITYASYLLRLQSVREDIGRTWIPSIQSTATGELRWFPNLDALLQFLHSEFGDREEQGIQRTGSAGQGKAASATHIWELDN